MTRRFKIEDLIIQNEFGVVFRALDTETGRTVAVRRFFPFETGGGGLLEEERAAYNIAVGRLAGLRHPALRAVVCGGCDPVDGIPFIATEWIEGTALEQIILQRRLPADASILLLTQALEVCELVSHVLAEEAVWVETDLNTIVFGDEESGRGFTFWISPLKWHGGGEQRRGLESIITLTEEIMGWKGQSVDDEAGQGLGAWLKWLRNAAPTTTLREARENLAAAIGSNPPAAADNLVSQAIAPPAPKSSKITVLGGLGLVLILTGLSGWLLTRNRPMPEPPDLESRPTDISEVNRRAAAFHEQLLKADREKEAALSAQREAVAKRGGVFSPAESGLLAIDKGRIATLEGHLVKTGSSQSAITTYLYFSENPPANEVRGALSVEDDAGFSAATLIGKKVRITGNVKMLNGRPEIVIAKSADIKAVE